MTENKKTAELVEETADSEISEMEEISKSADDILEVEDDSIDGFFIDAKDFRFVFCRGCGSEMRAGPLVICSDCVGDKVENFYKAATDKFE